MKTNIVIKISSPIPYIAKFWFSSYGPKCSHTNQIAVFFKMLYLNKEVHDNVYFWHADKH